MEGERKTWNSVKDTLILTGGLLTAALGGIGEAEAHSQIHTEQAVGPDAMPMIPKGERVEHIPMFDGSGDGPSTPGGSPGSKAENWQGAFRNVVPTEISID